MRVYSFTVFQTLTYKIRETSEKNNRRHISGIKGFLIHLKKDSVRSTNALFFRLAPVLPE